MYDRNKISGEIPSRENIGAVIVTHQPGHGLESVLKSIVGRVGKIVVVDNNSTPEVRARLESLTNETGCTLQLNEQNLGVAAGLTRAFDPSQIMVAHGSSCLIKIANQLPT